MNTKNNQRSKLTRKLFREAYLHLLHDTPDNRITVKSLCQIAEVNRSTFYLYYSEPEDILKEIEDATLTETSAYLFQIKSQRKDPLSAKESLLELLHYIQKNQLLFTALLIDNTDPAFKARFITFSIQITEQSFPVVLQTEEYKTAYRFISNGAISLIIDWLGNDCETSPKKLCNTLFTLSKACLDGISIDMSRL